MTCLIVGDSIAVGLASALKGCLVAAKVGMGSGWIAAHTPGTIVDVAFISSGSNDPTNPNLSANLESTECALPLVASSGLNPSILMRAALLPLLLRRTAIRLWRLCQGEIMFIQNHTKL
jgi:hypothetical protein